MNLIPSLIVTRNTCMYTTYVPNLKFYYQVIENYLKSKDEYFGY